jgi:hypothetical protein
MQAGLATLLAKKNALSYLGLRLRSDELGRGFRVPRDGPLFSTTGVTYGIPDGSCAPVIRIRS